MATVDYKVENLDFAAGFGWESTADRLEAYAEETSLTDDELRLELWSVAERAIENGIDAEEACKARFRELAQ